MANFKHNPLAKCTLRTAGLSSSKSATFGLVRKNKDGSLRAHQGVDFAANPNTPIYAVEDGEVISIVKSDKGFGNTITLKITKDGKVLYPCYCHLSKISVVLNSSVKAGDTLGYTGTSGNAAGMDSVAKGAHLHFGLKSSLSAGLGLNGWVDPLPFVTLEK